LEAEMMFSQAELKHHRARAVPCHYPGQNHGLYAVLMSSSSDPLEKLFPAVAGEALVADLQTRISYMIT